MPSPNFEGAPAVLDNRLPPDAPTDTAAPATVSMGGSSPSRPPPLCDDTNERLRVLALDLRPPTAPRPVKRDQHRSSVLLAGRPAPTRPSRSSRIPVLLTLLLLLVSLLLTPAAAASPFRPTVKDATAAFREGSSVTEEARRAHLHAADATDTLRTRDITPEVRRMLQPSPSPSSSSQLAPSPVCIPNLTFAADFNTSASQREGQLFMYTDEYGALSNVSAPAVSPAGNMYVTGILDSSDTVSSVFLLSFNSSGEVLWKKAVLLDGYTTVVGKNVAVDAPPFAEESILVTGTCWTASTEVSEPQGPVAWLASFSFTGGLNWLRVVSDVNLLSASLDSGWFEQQPPVSLILAPVPGLFYSDVVMSMVAGTGSLVVRFDSTGSLLWGSLLSAGAVAPRNGSEMYDLVIVRSLALAPDGSVVAVGTIGTSDVSLLSSILVASWNATGTLLWANAYSQGPSQTVMDAADVIVVAGGEIVVTGRVSDNFFVARFNAGGTFLAATTVPLLTGNFSAIGTGLAAIDGRTVITGTLTTSTTARAKGKPPSASTSVTVFAIMLDTTPHAGAGDSNITWGFTLAVPPYGLFAGDVVVDSQGRLVFSGLGQGSAKDSGNHGFIAVVDPDNPQLTYTTDAVQFSRLNVTLLLPVVTVSLVLNATATASLTESSNIDLYSALPQVTSEVSAWSITQDWYTYSVDLAALTADGIPTALVMFPWQYTLPLSTVFNTHADDPVAQPQLGVGLDWLFYDVDTVSFSGIPFSVPPNGNYTILITLSPVSTDVGTFYFSSLRLQLQLCIQSVPSTFLLFTSLGSMTTAMVGVSGTFITAGATDLSGFELASLSPNGTVLWDRAYVTDADISGNSPNLALLPDGDLIVVVDPFIYRVTRIGSPVWAKKLHSDWIVNSAVATREGHVVQTGEIGGNTTLLVFAVDGGTGELLWVRTLGTGVGLSIALAHPASTTDSSVIVTGFFLGNPSSTAFVMALNGTGFLLWASVLASPADSNFAESGGTCVDVDSADRVVVTLQLESSDSTYAPGVMVAVLTPSGALDWASSLVLSGTPACANPGVAWLKDGSGSIVVSAPCGDSQVNSNWRYNTLVASISAAGSVNWVRTIDIPRQYDLSGSTVHLATDCQANECSILIDAPGMLAKLNTAGEVVPPYSGGPHPVAYTYTPLSTHDIVWSNASVSVSGSFFSPETAPTTNASTHASSFPSGAAATFRAGYLLPGVLTPYVQVAFNAPLTINLSQCLLPDVAVILVQGDKGLPLPSWLRYDFVTNLLTGSPYGTVRLLYPVTLTLRFTPPTGLLVLGSNSVRITFSLNVPNTTPVYTGPSTLSTGLGSFGFPLQFIDAEGDSLFYSIGKVVGEQLPTFLSVSPTLGFLSGIAGAGSGGVYNVNVTAADAFGAIGWKVVPLQVNEPSALVAALENNWATILGICLLCGVAATLVWRERTTAKASFNLYLVAFSLCNPDSSPKIPATELITMKEDFQQATVALLDLDDFHEGPHLVQLEKLCQAVIAFAANPLTLQRNFVSSLGLGDFIESLLTYLDTRVVNEQLLELRRSDEKGTGLTYPVRFHRNTLLVIHILNRVVETILLCFSKQVPMEEAHPPRQASARVRCRLGHRTTMVSVRSAELEVPAQVPASGPSDPAPSEKETRKRLRRSAFNRASDGMRFGINSVVARGWIDQVGEVSGHVASPLGLPANCAPVELQILHGLAYLRQLIVYLPDTYTALDLFVSSLMKVAAPPDLLKDWMFIVSDVPAPWSLMLLKARLRCVRLMNLAGTERQMELLQFQEWLQGVLVRKSGSKKKKGAQDWRFVYGVTTLLGGLLQPESGLNAEERAQVCDRLSDAVNLGSSLSYWEGKWKTAEWIRAAAEFAYFNGSAQLRSTVHCFPVFPNPVLVLSKDSVLAWPEEKPKEEIVSPSGLTAVTRRTESWTFHPDPDS